jgi:hypothetical protein
MKTTWKTEFLQGLKELSREEEAAITGGESLWYWIMWGGALTLYMIAHPTPNQSDGQKAMNAALG